MMFISFLIFKERCFLGTATSEEIEWMKSKREDQEFIKELMKFGNFIHGTHVAGIAAQLTERNEISALKTYPNRNKASWTGQVS